MNRKNILNQSTKRAIFFSLLLIIGALSIIAYVSFTGNTNQVFTDVVNEFTSLTGSNKSAERNMFYIFSIAGVVICSAYYLLIGKKNTIAEDVNHNFNMFAIAALSVFNVASFVIYQNINYIAIAPLLLAIVTFVINKEYVSYSLAFFFITIYAIAGAYRLYVFAGGQRNLDTSILVLTTTILSLIVLLISKIKPVYEKAILILQIFIPFLILIFMQNRYLTEKGACLTIPVTKRIMIPIFFVIIGFISEIIVRMIKHFRGETSFQQILSFGTCASIMAFNQYYGTGSVIDLDLHHHFEDIIGYSQIFELGRAPYSQYIPVSGLYSVVHGFFFELFGHGLVAYYNVATNIYYLIAVLAVVYLLRKHLPAQWVLFISLTFYFGSYNRIMWMAPIFLLLSLPSLITNKNLWLKVWILTSYLHGLYYPIYGAAICLAFMPLGIWQIYTFVKEKDFKSRIKSAKFWLGWIATLLPIVLGIPLLLGTAKHMLAMANQTIFADGVTRFGQTVPDDFFPYINSLSLRLFLYYQASYLVIISIVWISVALFWANRRNTQAALLSISIALFSLVSISYSVVRCEVGDIYSRSDGFVKLAFLVLVIIVAKYMYNHNRNAVLVFIFACFLIALVSEEGFYKIEKDSKLESRYMIPEEYVYTATNDSTGRLGPSIIPESIFNSIQDSYNYAASLDKEQSYLGIAGNFGEYYFNSYKGDSVLELFLTVKGYGAAKETVDLIRKNHTIIGYSMNQVNNYYIYHYLALSGEYIWNPELRCFMPNNGEMAREEILASNKESLPALEDENLGKTAGSWGSSMESLESIFADVDVAPIIKTERNSANISFDKTIQGDEADFVYIDFDDMDVNYKYSLITQVKEFIYDISEKSFVKYLMKKTYNPGMQVYVEWIDDNGDCHRMSCEMDEGHLLVPVGAGKGWLFDSHNEINVYVTQDDESVIVPDIKEVRLLKLREVN